MSQQHSGTSQTTTSKYKQPSKTQAQSHKTVIDPLKRDSHWEKTSFAVECGIFILCRKYSCFQLLSTSEKVISQ